MAIVGGTWTYSGDPSADAKDAVRWLVGDTDASDQLQSDEEILYAIKLENDIYKAASLVAATIGGNFSRQVDKQVGDLKLSYSRRAQAFMALSDSLTQQANISLTAAAAPYNAALSIGEKK